MNTQKHSSYVLPALLLFLLIIGALLIYAVFGRAGDAGTEVSKPLLEQQHLALSEGPQQQGFKFQNVPPWLFVHVALIAAVQVFSLIGAYGLSLKSSLSRSQLMTIQFLCEVPMYLGLFGTLLGVCLTQFITGTLVAPLAYLTTMSGIVLHVFGKLAIWLPSAAGYEADE